MRPEGPFLVIMIQALLGQKIDQLQRFLADGTRIPVTKIYISENAVLQVKTPDKDKYAAVQLGLGAKKHATAALLGHSKKAKLAKAPQFIREVRLADDTADELPHVGDMISVDAVFKPGDVVAVTGTSKGKGFAGVVKRHHFRGGPKTHGQSDRLRAPGSIGQTTTPGRVYRGKRMAGHMGVDTVTVKNLTVVAVDATGKTLYVSGLVPGHRQCWLFIKKMGERRNFVPLMQTQPDSSAISETNNEAPKQNEAPHSVKK